MNAYAPAPSNVKYKATLTNGNAATCTVPSNHQSWVVSFRYYPNDVWVDVSGATAAIPVSNALVATTAELNPASLTLQAGTVISMITAQTIADESVFTLIDDTAGSTVPPPIEGYFLLLDGTNFLLLNGQNLTLL
jgi:hypothetical protein